MNEVTAVDAVIAGGGLAEDGTVTVEGRRVNGAWVFDSGTGPAAHPPVDAAPGRLTPAPCGTDRPAAKVPRAGGQQIWAVGPQRCEV